MAVIYLRSTDGNDADNGSTWALAKATLAAAVTAAGSGGTVYMSQAHAESVAGNISISGGTSASPVNIICVSDAAEPPTTLATSGSVTSTTGIVETVGFLHWYGVTLRCGDGTGRTGLRIRLLNATTSTSRSRQLFDTCSFEVSSSANSNNYIAIGVNTGNIGAWCTWRNCTVSFTHAAQSFSPTDCRFDWITGGVSGTSTVPTVLFNSMAHVQMRTYGVDFSRITTSLIDVSGWQSNVLLVDSKLGAGVALATGTNVGSGTDLAVINSDSSDTVYRYYRQSVFGTEQHETTIVRTGGATDGTTTVSRKVVTTANSTILAPYESMPLEFWNTSLSPQSITIPVLTDNVTLTDADAWIEVEYLGTSGNPLGVIVSGRVSDPIFGTPTNNATDSTSTWTTTGITTPVKQSLVSPSFTAQKAGLLRVWVKVARASTTLYYDPKALSSSGRQYMSEAGFVNEGASSGGGYSRGRVVNN